MLGIEKSWWVGGGGRYWFHNQKEKGINLFINSMNCKGNFQEGIMGFYAWILHYTESKYN